MNKLLIICGPTATGKTDIGVYLAKKYNGEIISADSRQVYQGMDIITGKDLPKKSELRIRNQELGINNKEFSVGYRLKDEIPIWLVDIVEPNYTFNVGEYNKLAEKVIDNIWLRNKLPVIVGGTGLYIKSLIYPLDQINIPPNEGLREKLNKLSKEQLVVYLKKTNISKWNQMNSSDKENPRRLIRAIEISLYEKDSVKEIHSVKKYDVLQIGLTASQETLNGRIDKRVDQRVKDGALEELRSLLQKYTQDNISFSATGYRQLLSVLKKEKNIEDAVKEWKRAEQKYAKRQMTWFSKEKNIHWFEITMPHYEIKIEEIVKKWYTSR